ncbi:MAG: hypothetical protein KJ667_07190 [Alphaproteobacteria bacterium]|nr:hypothetical protein [Alphaproteobacteria bacterium]
MRMALILAAVMVMAGTAQAGSGAAPAETPKDPVLKELRSAENPHIKIIEEKARGLVTPLSQPQMQDLYKLREGYGLIRSVEIVQRDIGQAVKFCGEDNPDLKKAMDERYKSWNEHVDPVLKERMSVLQAAVDAQTFASPAKIRDYFKALDNAAAYAESKFDKRIVTTPDACKSLRESMDDSEKDVADIMKDLKVPDFTAKAEPVPKAQ